MDKRIRRSSVGLLQPTQRKYWSIGVHLQSFPVLVRREYRKEGQKIRTRGTEGAFKSYNSVIREQAKIHWSIVRTRLMILTCIWNKYILIMSEIELGVARCEQLSIDSDPPPSHASFPFVLRSKHLYLMYWNIYWWKWRLFPWGSICPTPQGIPRAFSCLCYIISRHWLIVFEAIKPSLLACMIIVLSVCFDGLTSLSEINYWINLR